MEDRLKEKLTEYFKSNINGSHSIDDKKNIVNDVIDIVKSISLSPSDLLSDVEKENVKKYITKVKKKYGEVGVITYSFTSNGIGLGVSIKSSLKKKDKDITDYSCW